MLVTIQKATELTGKSRATVSRHIKEGRLSKTDKLIDTAELMRVYGALKSNIESSSNNSMSTHEMWLVDQIEALQHDLKELKAESLEREKQAIEREKRLMALLEHQSGADKSGGLFGRLFKS